MPPGKNKNKISSAAGPGQSHGARSRDLLKVLVLYAVLTITTAWLLGFWYVYSERQRVLAQSESSLQATAVGVAHQLGAMLTDGVGSARAAYRALDQVGDPSRLADADVAAVLGGHLSGGDYVKSLFFVDGTRFVQAVQGDASGGTTVPPPWVQFMPGDDATQWIGPRSANPVGNTAGDFPVALRVRSSRGDPAWVGAVFSSGPVQALLEEQRIENGVIGLYTLSGMPVALISAHRGEPGQLGLEQKLLLDDAVARRWPGPVEFVGPHSGVPMVFMGHLVSGYPIVAIVGLPRAEILAGPDRQALITFAILLATTMLAVLLVLHLKRLIVALAERDSRFRTLFDNAGVSIFLISGYRFIEMNQKTFDVFQLPADVAPAVLHPWDVSPPTQPDGTSSEILARRHIDEARANGQATFRWWHKRLQSGEEFPAQVSLSVLGNSDSDSLLAVVHDLGDLERARSALAELNADLERRVRARTEDVERANRRLALANEELELFAASASHDLRSPLGSISGMAGLLKLELDEGRNDTSGLRLDRIQAAVRRMAEIIDGLLALSRATGQEGEAVSIDLGAMAGDIADDLRQQHRDRHVETFFQSGLVVRAVPGLMRTLLSNLLENAWKYTSTVPAPRVELSGHPAIGGGVEYVVRDNGVGFDMRYADKLFKPFRRLHSVQEFPGMGLGLATVARIVRHYGGNIRGESEHGRGAAFHFTLPAASVDS